MSIKTDAANGAGAGLWIRVSANLSRRKVTWRLTDACLAQFPVPAGAPRSLMQKAAMGFLVEFWGNVAEHTVDGVIENLPDAQLEQWAGWDGEPGVFATWLRGAHLDRESGTVRDWKECMGALQSKRTNDAQRQREKRDRERKARELEDATQPTRGSVQPEPVVVHQKAPDVQPGPHRVEIDPDELTELARRFTIALNKGMNDNPSIGQMYNPVHAGRGDSLEFVTFLASEGIAGAVEWELVERIVYTIAKGYAPTKSGDQIRSLTFCRDKTLAMWRRARARAAAEGAGPIDEVPVSRGKTGSRGARSVAGALAAAAAVGLAE